MMSEWEELTFQTEGWIFDMVGSLVEVTFNLIFEGGVTTSRGYE